MRDISSTPRVLGPADSVGVAVIVPRGGPEGMFRPSCTAAATLAVEEVNATGGILGRELHPVFLDGTEPHGAALTTLSAAIDTGVIQGVTGWHISSVRHAVNRAVAGRVPYIYPTLYEGGEHHPGLLCLGETPDRQIVPAIEWLRREAGIRRWFVAGANYVWPRRTVHHVLHATRDLDIDVVGASFTGYGRLSDPSAHDDAMGTLLDAIEASGAEAVLMLFVGLDGAAFNRAFAERGLDRSLLRFSSSMEETMLLASGPDATRGLCVASGYFTTLDSAEAQDFRRSYHRRHGATAPTLNLMAEATYDGIRLMAHLANLTGHLDVPAMERALSDGVDYESPRGVVRIRDHEVEQSIHLAVANGCEFAVLDRL